VFPSVFEEPLGISQIEAMAAGLLVVSSGTGGAREVVRHRETGLLFSNGQAGELAAQLAMVYYAPEYAAQLAEAGRRAALAEFDVEVCAEALEAELIAMTKPAPARSG
jgi:glycosyltransferase involved in cell wall biosynthesis